MNRVRMGAALLLVSVTAFAALAAPNDEPGGNSAPDRSENLLVNGDFTSGTVGEMPDGWKRAGYSGGDPSEFRLVADRSFRRGNQVMRISHSGEGKPRIIESALMPLPTTGRLVLSFWARSDSEQGTVQGSLFGDSWNWQYQVMETFELSSAWQRFTTSGPAPGEIKADPRFFARFDVEAPGDVDIAAVSVTWVAPGAETDSLWIGAPGKNLLLNPDFELGWTGWQMDHFADWAEQRDRRVSIGSVTPTEPQREAGIDGGTALRLSDGTALTSFCVPIEFGQTYTVSAWYKAAAPDANAHVYFISTDWKMHHTSVQGLSTDRWERRSITFTWDEPLTHPRGYVRFDGDNVLIDRVQLEKGPLTAYEPPPVTVGLHAGDRNYFVRGRDEPRLSLIAIPSEALDEPYTVTAVARDAWDRVVWEQELQGRPGEPLERSFAPPGDQLGVFAVDLKAQSATGELLGIGVGRYAIIDPPATAQPGESRFGLHHETAMNPAWLSARLDGLFVDLGAGWNRFFFREGDLGLKPDAAWVEAVRHQLAPLNRRGIRQIGCVNFYPADLAERVIGQETPDPEALEVWGDHLTNLVASLRDDLRYWEILNEANLWRYADGPLKGQPSVPPEKYVQILRVAYEAIKSVDPDLQVVGVALNGTDWDWLKRFLELGGAKYMDVFSFHSYRSAPDSAGRNTYPDLLRFRAMLDAHGFTGPMINTEQYFAADLFHVRGNPEEVRRGYYVPGDEERRAAGRTIRNYIHHAAAGVPYCAFAVNITVAMYGGGEPYFLYHLFSAYNAATRFLARAGRGEMVAMGGSTRVFLFPDAAEGPLVTINASSRENEGLLQLEGGFDAYDFNGNQLTDDALARGIPVRVDPVYVRFPPGTQANDIRHMLAAADTLGMGEPFDARVVLSGRDELSVIVTNRRNRTLDGHVEIESLPDGWTVRTREQPFHRLAPGEAVPVTFTLGEAPDVNMSTANVSVLIRSGEHFLRRAVELRPVIATRVPDRRADRDRFGWDDAEWVDLGREHLAGGLGVAEPEADPGVARIAFGWHDDCFTIVAEVTDGAAPSAGDPAEAPPLRVYFDQLGNSESQTAGVDRDDVAYTLRRVEGEAVAHLDRAGSERYIGENNLSEGIDREVEVSISRRAGATVYEATFPGSVLPEIDLREGTSFGFSLRINGEDGALPTRWRSVVLVR